MGRIEQISSGSPSTLCAFNGRSAPLSLLSRNIVVPSTAHLASEGARALSVLTKSRNWDTQYTAIAPLLKSGRRTSRMLLATSRRQAKQVHDFCQQGAARNFRSQSTSTAKSRTPSALLGV